MKRFFGFFTIVAAVAILICGCDSVGGDGIGGCTITSANAMTETIKSGSDVSQKVYFTWDYTGTLEGFSFLARIAGTDFVYKNDPDPTKATKIVAGNVSPGTTFEVTITPSNGRPYSFNYTTPAETAPADNTITPVHAANSKTEIYDVTNENTISLADNDIKEIFLVKTNPTDKNSTSTRYIKSAYIENPIEKPSYFFSVANSMAEIETGTEIEETIKNEDEIEIIYYQDRPVEKKPLVDERGSNVARYIESNDGNTRTSEGNYPKIKGELGEKRTLYGTTGRDSKGDPINTAIPATLKYIDDANKCYVWVADDCFTEETVSNPGKKVDMSIVKRLADIFTNNANLVRNIFGDEKDTLTCVTSVTKVPNGYWDGPDEELPLSDVSAYGDYVNFFIYDLFSDFTGEAPKSGVLGFFTNLDYYQTSESLKTNLGLTYNNLKDSSNGGKFLHIDAAWAISNPDQSNLTILHEFQHLVQFGQKVGIMSNVNETWFAEMSSMLCEDMMQKRLNIKDKYSPKGRSNRFNEGYYKKSMFSWDSSSDMSYVSYATSYIFGAYLARKYGGADFVYDVMQGTPALGREALEYAIKKHVPSATWESIFRDFAADLMTGEVLNTSVTTTAHEMSSYNYPMTGFSIYDINYKATSLSYLGPKLFDAILKKENTIYAYGLNLSQYVHNFASFDKITFVFDGESRTGVKEYLVVVKK